MENQSNRAKSFHLKNCSIKRKGIVYPYYAIAVCDFRENKNQKKIVKYLGPLLPQQIAAYKKILVCLNEGSMDGANFDELVLEDTRSFLNVFTIHSVWQRLRLEAVFPTHANKAISTGQVAEILTLSKLLRPSAATKTVDWLSDTYLPQILDINLDKYNRMKIFHELSVIDQCHDAIEQHLNLLSSELSDGTCRVFFVDGTTTFFEGACCPIAQPGKDKTTGFRDQTILILLVTDSKGYPIAWDVCPGNETEVVRFRDLIERLCTRYKIKDFTFCFDRGFACAKNFKVISKFVTTHFISGLDKNQIEKVFDVSKFQQVRAKLLEEFETAASPLPRKPKKFLPINGFYTANGKKFFKELGVIGEYRYVAGFSCDIYKAMFTNRERQRFLALTEINDLNNELGSARGDRDLDVVAKRVEAILDRRHMKGIIEYSLIPKTTKRRSANVQSCKIEVTIDQSAWYQDGLLDGLFIYITDHTEQRTNGNFAVSAYQIVDHYRSKYIIEKDFRDLKNVINIRPLYVRLPEHVRALITVCILGQFINVYMDQNLKPLELSAQCFIERLNKFSSTARLRHSGGIVIKHLDLPQDLEKAISLLGLSKDNRLKIAAQLT